MGPELIGPAFTFARAVKRPAIRILSGKTAEEDVVLRRLVRKSLDAAIDELDAPRAIATVLDDVLLENGILARLSGAAQKHAGTDGVAMAWAAMLAELMLASPSLDLSNLDTPALCSRFGAHLWAAVREEATRGGSPVANLVTRLQFEGLRTELASSVEMHRNPTAPRVRLPSGLFVGRERDISRLNLLVNTVKAAVLTGAPGVGKSELASQWLDGQSSHTRSWIDASTVGSFDAALREVALTLNVPATSSLDEVLDAVLRVEGLSMVLDDADLSTIAAVLGRHVAARVVLTGVSAPIEYNDRVIDLEPLDRGSLALLAFRLLPALEPHEAEALVNLFPGQPLGVRQAAALVSRMGLVEFMNTFAASPVSSQRVGSVAGGRANMAALWDHALARLGGTADDAGRRVLSLLHVFGAHAVPFEFLVFSASVQLSPDDPESEREAAIRLLLDCQELRLMDLESGWARAHGLLREYCWDSLNVDSRTAVAKSAAATLGAVLEFQVENGGPQGLLFLDLVWGVCKAVDLRYHDADAYTYMLAKSVSLAMVHGQREPSLTLVDQALQAAHVAGNDELIAELVNFKLHTLESLASPHSAACIKEYAGIMAGDVPVRVKANFHSEAARAWLRVGDHARARGHAKEAMALAAHADDGERGPLVAVASAAAGFVEVWHGDVTEGARHLEQAHDLLGTVDGGGMERIALASATYDAFKRLGHRKLANEWSERLLDLAASAPTGATYEVAIIMGESGQLREALELLGQYVSDLEVFDNSSSVLRRAEALNTAGRLCLDHAMIGEARSHLAKAKDLLTTVEDVVSSAPHRADVLHNLALVALREEEYGYAADLAAKAWRLDRGYYGEGHLECASDLQTLAIALALTGQAKAALKRLGQAIEIWERPGAASQNSEALAIARQWHRIWSGQLAR